jgi:hypothetical protein
MKKSRKLTTIYSSKTNIIGLLQTNKELKANPKRIVEEIKMMPLIYKAVIKKEKGKEEKTCYF